MPSTVQKLTDIALVGRGHAIEVIKEILAYQSKKTFKHYPSSNHRFIDDSTLVIDGEKISSKMCLVVLEPKLTARKLEAHGEHPLPSNSLDQLLQTSAKSIAIVGNDTEALQHSLTLAGRGTHTTLICEQETLLSSYDTSVQGVVERFLKKQKISVLRGTPILSIEPKGNAMSIVCEQDGKPLNLTPEKLYVCPNKHYSYNFGLGNVSLNEEPNSRQKIQRLHKRIVVMQEDANIGLGTLYDVAELLLGRKKEPIDYVPREIYSSDSLSYFSIGVLEQDFFDTHISYKKTMVKLRNSNKTVQWFIKVLTSQHNTIIGIHGVLPYSYKNLDLLIGLVENRSNISELKNQCLATDELTGVFIEILGNA